MSNSIWKTGNLQEADTRKQILFYAGGGQFLYLGWNHPAWGMILAGSADWKYGDIQKWCYLDDLIAQADKAERLQKEITQELDIYYSPNPSLHPADDCVYAIEKIIGYKRKKSNN